MKYCIAIVLILFNAMQALSQPHAAVDKPGVRPNIVWIVCEDMSLRLSCFGEKAIQTPNLDALAKDGVKYTNTYTVAGVCAPSRNGIITGMYPMSIGGDNMRNYQPGQRGEEEVTSRVLPSYSIVTPYYVKCFPEFLRTAGYYCTNNAKEDYQFEAPVTVWDQSNGKAHWKNRPEGKPFFAIFNLGVTHESQVWKRDSLPLNVDPAKVDVPPYYPDVPEVRHDIARHLSNVIEMDRQAGKLIDELKRAGLYDNTIIFFYSDHGDGLPYVKREITKRGLHIPMIIKLAGNANAGTTDDQLINAIDFGPTVLSLAGIETPAYMHGRAFLGKYKALQPRPFIYASRDRMDGEVDRVRSVYDGRFQYLRNYIPNQTYYQPIVYRLQQPMMRKMLEMKEKGELNQIVMRWFAVKPERELYDLQSDPYQLKNLAQDPAYQKELSRMEAAYDAWYMETHDLHAEPEEALRNNMWQNAGKMPETAMPMLVEAENGYYISCATRGASIGYRIMENGNEESSNEWQVFTNEKITCPPGAKLMVKAQRIGYRAAEKTFTIKPIKNK